MELVPVNKRVVIELVEETKTESGIITSVSANEQIITGKVVSFAKDLESLKDVIAVGDTVFFNKHLATKFKKDETTLFSLKEEDILNVLK